MPRLNQVRDLVLDPRPEIAQRRLVPSRRKPDFLIAPIHSLFGQKKFFVPLRREFRDNILN
jgi:hypothetical protein